MQVRCPGCGEMRALGPEVQLGDELVCDACAGVIFRLTAQDGQPVLQEVPQASCPQCETRVRLPESVRVGETVEHCGTTLVVTHAYGAFALAQRGPNAFR